MTTPQLHFHIYSKEVLDFCTANIHDWRLFCAQAKSQLDALSDMGSHIPGQVACQTYAVCVGYLMMVARLNQNSVTLQYLKLLGLAGD